MITLQAPISPAPAADAARDDASGAETATSPDFAAVMSGMLSPSPDPAAAAATDAKADAGTAQANAKPGEQEPAAGVASGATAAVENAIAMALPAPMPGVFPVSIRGREAADAVDLPRSDAAPAGTNTAALRARSPAGQFHAAPAAADEAEAVASPPDRSTHQSVHPSDPLPLAPQAPDAAASARLSGLQAPPLASRAAEMSGALASYAPRIDAPVGSARWSEDLAGHVTLMLRNATSEAEIRVAPPELGPIHARISVDNGIASVTLSAPAPETRDALEAALATLRERFAESGLALGEASVSDHRAARDAPGGERLPRAADVAAAPAALLAGGAERRLRLDGLVDLYA